MDLWGRKWSPRPIPPPSWLPLPSTLGLKRKCWKTTACIIGNKMAYYILAKILEDRKLVTRSLRKIGFHLRILCSAKQSVVRVKTILLLLLLSHFSHVQLCVIPQTAAHQAPPFLGFSRQEHWSRLPFPSPMCESEVAQSCPTLSDPMDRNRPGSSIHVIFKARVLEWGAIAFSERQF